MGTSLSSGGSKSDVIAQTCMAMETLSRHLVVNQIMGNSKRC